MPVIEPLRILVVCTANQCRSPMGEVIARDLLRRKDLVGAVTSAGTGALDGIEATDSAQRTVRRLGLDLAAHLSRQVTPSIVAGTDLVLAMERRHLVDLTNDNHASLVCSYTIPELAALAAATPRMRGEVTSKWLARVGDGRTPTHALQAPEIEDPTGRSLRKHRATAATIAECLSRILDAYGAGSGR